MTIRWSRHSRLIEPIILSTKGFCQDDRGNVTPKGTICLAFVVQHDEDHEKPERGGRPDQEIDRRESHHMVAQESSPRL